MGNMINWINFEEDLANRRAEIEKAWNIDIIKARSGVYENTEENRKLGRVGQKYGNKKEDLYEKIKDYARQIINGTRNIERLLPKEERGRIAGGRRNVEATLLLRGDGITDSTEPSRIDTLISLQERKLEKYAKEESIWVESSDIDKNWKLYGGGQEAKVYFGKPGYLKKVINYDLFSISPLEFIDNRISLHNYLFPFTAYKLIGFTKNKNGLAFILEQKFVKGKNSTVEKIAERLKDSDFKSVGDNTYVTKDYIIEDLHKKNVLSSNTGRLFFIDTVPSLNTKDSGYGGTREYGKIKI